MYCMLAQHNNKQLGAYSASLISKLYTDQNVVSKYTSVFLNDSCYGIIQSQFI